MPTYTNNSSGALKIVNFLGVEEMVLPGNNVQIDHYFDNDDFTLAADTPYYNRVVNRQTVTLSGTAAEIDIGSTTDYITVLKITGEVTVYCQSTDNTPPELNEWLAEDPIIQIPAKRKFNKLALTGSGTCEVIEYNT